MGGQHNAPSQRTFGPSYSKWTRQKCVKMLLTVGPFESLQIMRAVSMINTCPSCNYCIYGCPPFLLSHLYQAGWRQRWGHCREGHLKPQQHTHGHFVRVTEHFTLHQTQRHPLRQDIRKHSFHFLTLNTERLWLPPSHPAKIKKKKKKRRKKKV